jgi:hypothetical protein
MYIIDQVRLSGYANVYIHLPHAPQSHLHLVVTGTLDIECIVVVDASAAHAPQSHLHLVVTGTLDIECIVVVDASAAQSYASLRSFGGFYSTDYSIAKIFSHGVEPICSQPLKDAKKCTVH